MFLGFKLLLRGPMTEILGPHMEEKVQHFQHLMSKTLLTRRSSYAVKANTKPNRWAVHRAQKLACLEEIKTSLSQRWELSM